MKRIVSIILVLASLAFVLSGCSNKINEDKNCKWSAWTTEKEKTGNKKTKFVSVCSDCGKKRSYSAKYSKGLEYIENDDGTLSVSGIGDCDDEFVYISAEKDGKKVVAVAEDAFNGVSSMKYLYVSESVKNIGDYAFVACENLLTATLAGAGKMGAYAFYECVSLYDVELSEGITRIEDYTFSGCFDLRKIDLPEKVDFVGVGAFSRCTAIKEISFPKSVKLISKHVFDACASLEKVDVPGAEGVLEESAFASCKALKSFDVPEGIHTLGVNAFIGCESLRELYLPSGVTTIYVRDGESPFFMCSKDLTVKCQAGAEGEFWDEGYNICNFIEYDDPDKETVPVYVKFLFGQTK